ncbi:MAG: hypothetical protein ACUZ8I_12545 [Candidatus Scalindua sp.]
MTQKKVVAVVGVARTTIEEWNNKNVSNDENVITNTPDMHISIPKDEYKGGGIQYLFSEKMQHRQSSCVFFGLLTCLPYVLYIEVARRTL